MICSLFGHRDTPPHIKPLLKAALVDLIKVHHTIIFWVGTQGNFDRMAISLLKELQPFYPYISFAVILAYMPHDKMQNIPCETILPEGIETVPPKYAIPWRNKWMIRNSDMVLAYTVHRYGGAAKAVDYARTHKKPVNFVGIGIQ